jgi:hypothetical protein
MGDDMLVRNSRMLGLLDQVLHGPLGTLRAVELAGRGISAEARCTQAVLEDKMTVSSDPSPSVRQRALAAADLLTDLGAVEDDLAEAWRRRCTDDLDDLTFEAALDSAIRRLEEWPARWRSVDSA